MLCSIRSQYDFNTIVCSIFVCGLAVVRLILVVVPSAYRMMLFFVARTTLVVARVALVLASILSLRLGSY